MRRSADASFPVCWQSVQAGVIWGETDFKEGGDGVGRYVAVSSVMKLSRSTLHVGSCRARDVRVRVAVNFRMGLGDEKNSRRTAEP